MTVMLVHVLLILTLGYQAILLWRGRLISPLRIGFRARHLRWASGLWIGYGVPALIGLLAIGRLPGIGHLPPEFLPLAWYLEVPPGSIGIELVAIGLAGGSLLGLVLTWWRARRGRAPWTAGDARSIMPTSDADLWPAAALAVSAGVAEELFYRLWLPLIVALASGSGTAGVVVGTLCFAAMHRYQGWAGVAANTVGGGLLTALYFGSGALWLPIAVHALVDLNALVLRPAFSARLRR
ncbi:membrane protease YdiL (CAAX protease family) [Sphingomonas insulae]|uniref:CAAX prenyl protease 2/Lysostaphin resistance protein A-like domain-containing protein n=1 Tax=Sphingomonas insulae TaxID=424800 RepID=A0ABN1HPS7_9SPHN|nr:CPBP family intramembrane glutamic endopeptidase [Sphingomonas insulae]NIJ31291.1 membrane protease YdiL (CAAX protease family) [Sphingomonas insulae]